MSFNLRSRLKRSYSVIRSRLGKKDTSEWLYDNFYLIDRYYRVAVSDKRALSFRGMYSVIEKYCEESEYEISVGGLITYLKAERRDFIYYELCSAASLLAVCAINKAADSVLDGNERYIPKAVRLLISLSDPSWEEIIPAVWSAEAILAFCESGYDGFDKETKTAYRILVAEYAKSNKISESDAVRRLKERAKSEGIAVGEILFAPKSKYTALWISWVVLTSSALILSAVMLFGWISALLVVPLVLSSVAVADIAVSRIVPVFKAPRYALGEVPESAKNARDRCRTSYGRQGG